MISHGGGEMPPIGAVASLVLIAGFAALVVIALVVVFL